jgi:hypothetical protein
MHFIDNVLLPPQGDVDQWQQRRRSILPPSTVQDMSPPAAAQNSQQEQNNNGGVREPSFTVEAPPGGDRAQSGRQRNGQTNGGANRNGDTSAARNQEAEDEIEEVSSSLPFGISSAVVPPPDTSSPPPAPGICPPCYQSMCQAHYKPSRVPPLVATVSDYCISSLSHDIIEQNDIAP